MRYGYFGEDGRCLVIYEQLQEPVLPADFEYAFAAEVPAGIMPNEAFYDKDSGTVTSKPVPIPTRPPQPSALELRVAELEARVKKLEDAR